jgi:alkanesulfonate monooxygenase SsuD/methylene tetrahydromethanopterin reductase-like flavin-dependent oxidoreductase (luciferase family)
MQRLPLSIIVGKMAATVDVISNGRLNFGIGAGWHETEAAAYGIPFPRGGVRVEMLDEALTIIKKLWTEDKVTFKGKYYSINDAISLPKPVQKPYPPILVGGGGDKMLRVIARHANAWDCGFESLEDVKKEIARLETACREMGQDLGKIENTFQSRVIIAETEEDALKRTERWCEERQGKLDDPDWKFAIKGSPEACMKTLKAYVDTGVTHFTLLFADVVALKPLRLFADKVMPEFH